MDRRKFVQSATVALAWPSLSRANTWLSLPAASLNSLGSETCEEVGLTRISLVAIGGAGIRMASQIEKTVYGLHQIVSIDTCEHSLIQAKADQKILLLEDNGKRPNSDHDAFQLAHGKCELIKQAIYDSDLVIILVGLGGVAGTGIASVVADIAKSYNVRSFALAFLPSDFERYLQTRTVGALFGLRTEVESLTVIPNELHSKINRDSILRPDTLPVSTKALKNYLWNTCGCVNRMGLVDINLEDIRIALEGGRFSSLGWGVGRGPQRGEMAVKQAFENELLQPEVIIDGGCRENHRPALNIRGLSVSIRGARSILRMKDIHAVLEHIRSNIGPYTQEDDPVLLSCQYVNSLEDSVEVSIIANWS